MPENAWLELSQYRIKNAEETLETAELLYENQRYKDRINRSYYVIFHAMRAVLALEGADYKKHSGVIARFREGYIKPGILPVELSDIIGQASLIRNQSDYEDFFLASAEEAKEQLANAKAFLEEIQRYLLIAYESAYKGTR